jgi:hypothetical protein
MTLSTILTLSPPIPPLQLVVFVATDLCVLSPTVTLPSPPFHDESTDATSANRGDSCFDRGDLELTMFVMVFDDSVLYKLQA